MIRLAKKEDLKIVNRIRKEVFDLHVHGRPDIFQPNWAEKSQMEYLQTFLTDENLLLYVCEREGKILGYAMIEKKEKLESVYSKARKWCEISDLGVTTKQRGKGVGTELFDFLKKELKKLGFPRIELNVWEFNEGAVHFYEKNGFETSRRFMQFDL